MRRYLVSIGLDREQVYEILSEDDGVYTMRYLGSTKYHITYLITTNISGFRVEKEWLKNSDFKTKIYEGIPNTEVS